MRFLHIVPERPLANGSGAQLRAHALSRALTAHGQVITLALSEILDSAGLRPTRARSFIEADLPETVLRDILHRLQPVPEDVAIVEGVHLSAVARRLCAEGLRVILDAHNVESDLLRQTDLARRPWLARLTRRRRWHRAEKAERTLLGLVPAVWACSQLDAERMQRLAPGMSPPRVLPNPVPDWCLAAGHLPRGDGVKALFVGHLGYRPNLVAAGRLVRNILPALRRSEPDARLTLAGRAPHPSLHRLLAAAPPGLTLIADPTDLAPVYAQATMALIPLSEGGGTRIKALEAMSLGLPVVASAKAVEGLDLVPGRQFLLAESDAEFVNAALRLSRTPALRDDLAGAARDFALRHHGPSAIETAVTHALQDLRR